MNKHYVTVTQKYVGQFYWKIEGYAWQSAHGKGGELTKKKENMVQRVYDICNNHK